MAQVNRVTSNRNRQLLNQPWYLDDRTFGKRPPKGDVELPPLATRLTERQKKVYERRADIINALRGGEKPEALARRYNIDVQFIRWIDGRSRA